MNDAKSMTYVDATQAFIDSRSWAPEDMPVLVNLMGLAQELDQDVTASLASTYDAAINRLLRRQGKREPVDPLETLLSP